MSFKKGDHVVFKCTNPATGWVLRVAKDGSWADVLWNSGPDCQYVKRHEARHMVKVNPIFNRLATDPLARLFFSEELK